MDQHWLLFWFLSVQYYCFNQSWAKPLSQQRHKLLRIQRTGTSQSETNTCSCLTPHGDSLYSRYCWPPVSLCWAFYTTDCTYFSSHSILQKPLKCDWRLQVFPSVGAWGQLRDSALFNKQLHVIQSNWNYLIIMLNNNKAVVLFNVYSLTPLFKHVGCCLMATWFERCHYLWVKFSSYILYCRY